MTEELQKKMQELAELHADNFTIDLMRQNALISFIAGFTAAFAHLAPLVEWNDVREKPVPENKDFDYLIVKYKNGLISIGNLRCDFKIKDVAFWQQIEL